LELAELLACGEQTGSAVELLRLETAQIITQPPAVPGVQVAVQPQQLEVLLVREEQRLLVAPVEEVHLAVPQLLAMQVRQVRPRTSLEQHLITAAVAVAVFIQVQQRFKERLPVELVVAVRVRAEIAAEIAKMDSLEQMVLVAVAVPDRLEM
jgi:hypothetical protein